MDLERGKIERSDFPTARRGYEPRAVDAHLREVAAAVERLEDRIEELSARPATLSEAANERLQRILEAAEASAAELRTEAEEEVRSLVREAETESRTKSEEAERRAQERDAESEAANAERMLRVDRRTSELMGRADSIDQEADRLVERMRDAATAAVEALRGDVEGLRAELDELPGESVPVTHDADTAEPLDSLEADETAGAGRGGAEGEVDEDLAPLPEEDVLPVEEERDEATEPLGDEVIPEPAAGEPLPEPPEESTAVSGEVVEADVTAATDEPAPPPRADGAPTADSEPDTEGARLIALNMALSGSSRSETADYLRETFGIEDGELLDDVYDRVQAT